MSKEKKYFLKLTAEEIDDLVATLIEAETAAKERSTCFAELALDCTEPILEACYNTEAICQYEKGSNLLELRRLIKNQQLSQEAGSRKRPPVKGGVWKTTKENPAGKDQ